MVDQIRPGQTNELYRSSLDPLPPMDERIEAFRQSEENQISSPSLPPAENTHWKMLLSHIVNASIIRDLVFFAWRTSLTLMHSTSNLFNKDFSLHLYSNPIPDYFDDKLKAECLEIVKNCFIDQMNTLKQEEPSEELFGHLSTLRIPEALTEDPIFDGECQLAFTQTLRKLLERQRQLSEDGLHLWIGLQETPPDYALENHKELNEVSPDFIKALSRILSQGEDIPYLHFFGELGGLNRIQPLITALENNPSVTYIQLAPNNGEKDKVFLILPSFLEASPHIRQIVINPAQDEPINFPEEYWPFLTHTITNHNGLQSLICRNMGNMPEEHQEQIRRTGKHISWT